MAKAPPKSTQFKKGSSGNPGGRRKDDKVLGELRRLSVESYRQAIELIVTGSKAEVQALATQTDSMLHAAIAHCFVKAVSRGDFDVVDRILGRVIGKIPDVIHMTSTQEHSGEVALKVEPDEKLMARIAKIMDDV
jgi:hypothetical protein